MVGNGCVNTGVYSDHIQGSVLVRIEDAALVSVIGKVLPNITFNLTLLNIIINYIVCVYTKSVL